MLAINTIFASFLNRTHLLKANNSNTILRQSYSLKLFSI
jgi:hypothetical protein